MNRLSVTPNHDLPDWIQRARQGIDWGALLVLVLSLMAASHFLLQPSLPLTTDGESLLFRTADTVASFREGRLYPRWSPHALHGYGAPIPHYAPPGVSWTAAVISFVANTDPVNALRALWVLTFIMAGQALYALVMRRVNAVAGLFAAALYLFSPYVGLTLPHITGNMTEMLGLSLVLMHLWVVSRLSERNAPWDVAGVACTGAALILTSPLHAALALVLTIPLLMLATHPLTFPRFCQAWSLGGLISAFYWLPALLEQDSVRWLTASADVHQSRLSLGDLLRPASLFDPAELIPLPQLGLGTALLLAAVSSLLVIVYGQRRAFFQQIRAARGTLIHHASIFQILYLMLGLVGLLWCALYADTPTWFVGVLTICFAIGSTLFLSLRDELSPRRQRVALAAVGFLVTLTAMPVLFPTRPFLVINTAAAAQIQYEQQRLGVVGVAPGDPVPTTLTASFIQSDIFVPGYETDTVNRFSIDPRDQNRASVVLDTPETQIFQVWKPDGGLITTQIAAFAGWSAWLDDTLLPTSVDPDTGLLQILLPPSQGQTLTITLDTTPIRILSWGTACAGLLILALWVSLRVRHEKPVPYQKLIYLTLAETRLLIFVLCLTVGGILFGYSGQGSFSLRPQGWYAIRESVFLRGRSNAGLELLAYRLDQQTFHPGNAIPLTLYWQATQALGTSYTVEISIRDVSSGHVLVTSPAHPPAGYTTQRWIRGMYMRDDSIITLPPDVPMGRYVIAVKVYPCERECRPDTALTFFDGSGQMAGTLLTLPNVLDITP
jgi:hypothetical protein